MRNFYWLCSVIAPLIWSCGGGTTPPQDITPPLNSTRISISTPVALDDLIVNAEAKVIKLAGTTDVADGQTVTVTFSDGNATVELSARVENGAWFTGQGDISALQNGDLLIIASVTDVDGSLEQTSIDHVRLDKSILPPAPPEAGTIWIVDGVITSTDPSTLTSLTPNGTGSRTMYDRRANAWVNLVPLLFNAEYSSGETIEVQVNPEFSAEEALSEARKYAEEIGRLPKVLRRDAETVWIHKGRNPFGGGNNNYLIHTGMADEVYIPRNNLEETLVHEGAHTSLDSHFKDDPDWLYAQVADGTFVSQYARDNPNREDIAETFLLYLAYRYRPNSLTQAQKDWIVAAMSYRMDYFDKQNLDLSPFDN